MKAQVMTQEKEKSLTNKTHHNKFDNDTLFQHHDGFIRA